MEVTPEPENPVESPPSSEEQQETSPEAGDLPVGLEAEETELLEASSAVSEEAADVSEETDETTEESDEEAEAGEESAASKSRRRRRRRRRRGGLALREEAEEGGTEAPSEEPAEVPIQEAAAPEEATLDVETGTAEDVISDTEEATEEAEEDNSESTETTSSFDRRHRRTRQPLHRKGRRPVIEQALISNPEDPDASPLRVDIQPGVGKSLVGRSIIGFREAYDIGGGERPGISFQVLVLDDGSQWRIRGSDDFDPWLERLLPGEDL
jgi:hypothetical protein